ncbi:cysteine-rich RLK (RECEPTOR-like protein kinase) 8 [Raphanus sativus]|nr:cysteine-rich RLK (RECEPTOR-like protein kinase) 8 [Raphanus sativus]KAJ4899703.1 cysteine-rich RLK (RECEPTOR-like protein kinase) 8 [Raphanus sativus]KAJ4899710.1 cysteine-rich RLK (RECEPTOR-like protein kinase) 8 [Raphanus sativus]
MSSCTTFIFLALFSLLASFRAYAQNPRYTFHSCPNATTYTRNSTYSTNLKTLLSSLSSPDASYSTGFQNATVGRDPDRVTGLFLCRGDVSPEVCHRCVAFSVNDTLARCPNESEVVLYYEECMLRYSHQNILSTLVYEGGFILLNGNIISSNQEDRFEDLVSTTMNQAADKAANSSKKFYTIKANWTALQSLYGLVQCTPDLTRYECLRCLHRSIDGMPLNRIGGRLFWPSCNSRYELYSFFNENDTRTPEEQHAPPPPSPSPLPPPPASISPVSSLTRTGKHDNSKVLIVAIVVGVVVAVLILIAGYCFLAKRTKKISDNAPAFYGDDITTIESLQLDYRIIQAATNNYSENNKIGEGGFGEVYKGTFANGVEVAVKRLSKSSRQGDTEFKNEIVVVAKLQHRNLVRLLGFSLEQKERILV